MGHPLSVDHFDLRNLAPARIKNMADLLINIVSRFDLLTLFLIILAAFGTAVFSTVSGFAGGVTLSICLAPIVGIKEVIPLVVVAVVISNTARFWAFRKTIRWDVFWSIMILGWPGIVLGTFIYIYLPEAAIAAILGLFCILTIPLRRILEKKNFQIGLRGLFCVGGGYGLVAGTTVGAGMVLIPFLLGAGLVGESLVGMNAALGFVLNVTKTFIFGTSTLLDLKLFLTGIMVGIFTVPGAYTGRWIVRKTPIRIHTVIIEILIFIGGLYFLWNALVGPG